MLRGASAYERELKDLFQGDPTRVRAYAKSIEPTARAEFEQILERPFLVIRAAGSFGFDLVALRREFAFPLEVKASGESTVRFSAGGGRSAEQLLAHRAAVDRVGLMVLYAYRRIGLRGEESWRIFSATQDRKGGMIGVLARRVPPVESTRDGNGILRWENGMPLSVFLRTFRFLIEPVDGAVA
ncbi:MAG: Holliday junction resolvase [Thermoplasmata archaeon]